MNNKRLNYLDSIRGTAACLVLLQHCWLSNTNVLYGGLRVAFSSIPNFIHYDLDKVLAGRAAVMVFFVLSGFVLAYSLEKKPMTYIPFAIKRILRIYPAYAFVILVSYALHRVIGVQHGVNSKFLTEQVLNPDLSWVSLIKHLVLWGTQEYLKLNVVIWSLVHEFRISLIFPLILLWTRRYRWHALMGFGLFSLGCTVLSFYTTGQMSTGTEETTLWGSLLATGFFTVFFAAGSLLALEREQLTVRVISLQGWKKVAILAVVGLCLLRSGRDLNNLKGAATDYICGTGAFGLILLSLGVGKMKMVLSHKLPVWLGRISYSLYLVHIPIIYTINQTLGGKWPPFLATAAVIVLALAAAELMARFIEFPSIALGKKLSTKAASFAVEPLLAADPLPVSDSYVGPSSRFEK